MRFVGLILVIVVLSVNAEQWHKIGSKEYFFSQDKKNYGDAIQSCLAKKSVLASITSTAEQKFVVKKIKTTGCNDYLIGATRKSKNTFVWQDGTTVGNEFWHSGEPNDSGGKEDCVHLWKNDLGWNDIPCGGARRYICMKSESTAECTAYGDPHYKTFDGNRWYDFQGTCVYYMARTRALTTGDPNWFSVVAKNHHRGRNTRVSFVQFVEIALQGRRNIFHLGQNKVIMVNRQKVDGYSDESVTISYSGMAVVLVTRFGLRVTFNGHAVTIQLPSTFINKVDGLCGNYNNDPSDDLTTNNGVVVADFKTFALSYQLEGCTTKPPPPFHCTNPEAWERIEFCGSLKNPSSGLSDCNEQVDVEGYYKKCIYDCCATNGDRQILTQELEAYTDKCQEMNVDVCDWREKTGSDLITCWPNSEYKGCTSPCPNTCLDPNASDNCDVKGTVEGCECSDGFLKEGDRCIRPASCGCLINGNYVKQDGYIKIGKHKCFCIGVNEIECKCMEGYGGKDCTDINECDEEGSCDENAICSNTLGSFKCKCKPGYVGDGKTCTDINECNGKHDCGTNEICLNIPGSFKCECKPGYGRNGKKCKDINECKKGLHNCGSHSKCINKVGSYTCKCNKGYRPTTCEAIFP